MCTDRTCTNECYGGLLLHPHEMPQTADASRMGPRQSVADLVALMGRPAVLLPSEAADAPFVIGFTHLGGRLA